MQKYLILLIGCFSFLPAFAQEEIDTTDSKDCQQLVDLIWIKDSAYGIFKTHRVSNLRILYPSFRTYKAYIDTSVAGSQSEITKFTMYNSFWNGLRFDFLKLQNKTQKAGVDWEKTVLDSFFIDTGYAGGPEYAYVHWIVKYNKKRKYHYSALFIKMKDKWFLLDELKFVGMVVEKKKKKKKK